MGGRLQSYKYPVSTERGVRVRDADADMTDEGRLILVGKYLADRAFRGLTAYVAKVPFSSGY